MKKTILTLLLSSVVTSITSAQNCEKDNCCHHAWEIGIGGSLTNWNRVIMSNFRSSGTGYIYDTDVRHIIAGPHIYIARELTPWLYLDAQGSVGISQNKNHETLGLNKTDLLWMGGLGIQFRATPLLHSKYVEPFARVGISYLHKNFNSSYAGKFSGDITGQAHWKVQDAWNNLGKVENKKNFVPISIGLGLNAWLSERWGLGLQGDYLMPLQKNMPRLAQGSLRLLYRIGGKSKARATEVIYIDRPIEKIVEKHIVERVEVPVETVASISELLENIEFEFDKAEIPATANEILDTVAKFLNQHTNERFLLTGHTDARGSVEYNLSLSRRRAESVYKALIARDVPSGMLKWRGVHKAAHAMPASAEDKARRGDRKVQIERITNMTYWEALK